MRKAVLSISRNVYQQQEMKIGKLIYERKIILIKNGNLNNPLTIRMIYKYINSVMDNKAVNYTSIPITERLGTYLDQSNKNRHLE
jgi:hypothetical protein